MDQLWLALEKLDRRTRAALRLSAVDGYMGRSPQALWAEGFTSGEPPEEP